MIELRPYQVEAINALRENIKQGHRAQILYAPTGAGKTITVLRMIERAIERGQQVRFIADRIALVQQVSAELRKQGIVHGVAQGANTYGRTLPVQVVAAQTAKSRAMDLQRGGLIIVDECHIIHNYIAAQIEKGGDSVFIGLSATPFRERLGEFYTRIVNVRTTNELIDEGYLTPLKIFSPRDAVILERALSLSSSGEFDEESASREVMRITGNVVDEWERRTRGEFGGPVKTICFSASVADGETLAAEFRERGHSFHLLSYRDTPAKKADLIDLHRRGEILGLVSCEALQRGYDVPDIQAVIDCHPYRKSLSSVIQQFGRGMRPAEGKEFCLLLDHASNFIRFRADIEEVFTQGAPDLVERDKKARSVEEGEVRRGACPECDAILYSRKCRNCGFEVPKDAPGPGKTREIVRIDGEMVALTDDDIRQRGGYIFQAGKRMLELPTIVKAFSQLKYLAIDKYPDDHDKARRWSQAKIKSIYGAFAKKRFENVDPETPDRTLIEAVNWSNKEWLNQKRKEWYARR